MYEVLKTATGKTFRCDYFNLFAPAAQLNISIVGTPLTEVAQVFSDAKETVQLWCGTEYCAYYTQLLALFVDGGSVRIVLERT